MVNLLKSYRKAMVMFLWSFREGIVKLPQSCGSVSRNARSWYLTRLSFCGQNLKKLRQFPSKSQMTACYLQPWRHFIFATVEAEYITAMIFYVFLIYFLSISKVNLISKKYRKHPKIMKQNKFCIPEKSIAQQLTFDWSHFTIASNFCPQTLNQSSWLW